jgi:hypothetical protein
MRDEGETPCPGRSPAPRNDHARAAPPFHGHVDTTGARPCAETHGVDLIMQRAAWRAVPTPRAERCPRTATGLPCSPPARPDPRPWAGGRVGGTTEPRGCAGGRPRRGGHARSRRDRPCRVPTQLSGGPDPSSQDDHSQLPRSPGDVLVRRSGRQDEPPATQPPHRQFPHPAHAVPQRATRGMPAGVPIVNPRGDRADLQRRISDRPTRRHPRIAPTPPTRAPQPPTPSATTRSPSPDESASSSSA